MRICDIAQGRINRVREEQNEDFKGKYFHLGKDKKLKDGRVMIRDTWTTNDAIQ